MTDHLAMTLAVDYLHAPRIATYRVMLTDDVSKLAKVAIIVASTESQAMQFAELLNRGFSAQFTLKMFAGSPAD